MTSPVAVVPSSYSGDDGAPPKAGMSEADLPRLALFSRDPVEARIGAPCGTRRR